ncbi:hypothetical protein AB4171_09445, partial [Vibrio sp. 10N.286.51.A4]|uniref:hypothetical protein n=1 Tax=Vibrio sp. 10N.286.51.A4 TaxID=3229705 RepID=UPI00354B65B0
SKLSPNKLNSDFNSLFVKPEDSTELIKVYLTTPETISDVGAGVMVGRFSELVTLGICFLLIFEWLTTINIARGMMIKIIR